MAQSLPIYLQLLNNPTFSENLADGGMKFDGFAMFKNFTDIAGYKFAQDMVVPMTPQEKMTHQANKPAALQANQMKANQMSQQQQFQHEETMEDEKQLGKAGAEVLRQSIEQATTPLEVTGQPGGVGFGSTTAI
jgi:hypothetical protein